MTGPIHWADDDPALRIPAEDMTLTPAWGGHIRIAGQQGDTVRLGPLQGESASAALRRTQQDLAASQTDLSHVERQLRDTERELYETQRLVDQKQDRLGEYSDLFTAERAKRELVEAELASARTELEQLRTWQVARQHVGDCYRCGQPMNRGHAIRPQPGTTHGGWAHVECDQ